jgi:hypothetical protein
MISIRPIVYDWNSGLSHGVNDSIMRRVTLGWSQYLVVLLGLGTIAMVLAIVIDPVRVSEVLFRLASQRFERRFGFEIGVLAGAPTAAGEVWGLVRVDPDSVMARAGLRAGDTPFDVHGAKFEAFHWALTQALAGKTACFDVTNVEDWRIGHYTTREVCLNTVNAASGSPPTEADDVCHRTGEWDTVLALAARPVIESREALQRAARDDTDAGRLAAFVLKDMGRTGRSPQPKPGVLTPVHFSSDELQSAMSEPTPTTMIAARVEIDPRGCPSRVEVVNGPTNSPFAHLVVDRLRHAVYAPAWQKGQYTDSIMYFSTLIDLRR